MHRPQAPSAHLRPLLAVLGLLLALWFGLAPKASAASLPLDHGDLFAASAANFASASQSEHQETSSLPPKNRVWEIFENPNEITPADEVNSLQLRWESHFGELELASGVLSYADGNPISKSDPFGLAPEAYPVRQPTGVGSFFSQTLPDTAVAVYKGAMGVPGQIVDGGTKTRQQAQSDFGRVGDPISGSIVSAQWTIGAGLEFFGGMAGVVKTPENLYHAGEYHASREGLLGQHEQNKAIIEDYIFDTGINYGRNNPGDVYKYGIQGHEVSIGGQLYGGSLRTSAISSTLSGVIGGSPTKYNPIGWGVSAVNFYGGKRGSISNFVNSVK